MRYHNAVARLGQQIGVERRYPGNQVGAALAAWRREGQGIGCPAIKRIARHIVPGDTFPVAEIQLQQPCINLPGQPRDGAIASAKAMQRCAGLLHSFSAGKSANWATMPANPATPSGLSGISSRP
jgi:hypothetical protein